MVVFNNSGNTGINWGNQDNFNNNSRKIWDIDNVIDVMIINRFGHVFSYKPDVYADKVNLTSQSNTDKGITFRCNDDKNEPILARQTKTDIIQRDFATIWNNGRGAWHNNGGDERSVNDGGFKQTQLAWASMKQSDPGLKDSDKDCTEFSMLYHRLDCVQYLMIRGYKFFEPNNFNSYRNWIEYDQPNSSNNHWNYLMVMYLSAENFAKEWGCFNKSRNDNSSVVRRLFTQNLTRRDNMLNMGNAFCSSAIPYYSYLSPGQYEMGTTIYSPDTEYKAILQPDGNFVIYKLGASNADYSSSLSATWSSNTFLNPRAVLALQSDGNVVIYSRRNADTDKLVIDAAIWNTGTNTGGRSINLGLNNGGVLFAYLQDGSNFNIYWTSNNDNNDAKSRLINRIYTFYDKCADTTYINDKTKILEYKVNYCLQGDKLLTDENCKNLLTSETIKDDSGNTFKSRVDSYVMNTICKTGYDAAKYGDFCSCVNPSGDIRKIFESSTYSPLCWSDKCQNIGYHTKDYSTNLRGCPTNMCIQNITMTNVKIAAGANVSQGCKIDNTSAENKPTSDSGGQKTTTGGATPAATTGTTPTATTGTTPTATTGTTPTATNVTVVAQTPYQKITNSIKNPASDPQTFILILLFIGLILIATYNLTSDSVQRIRRKKKQFNNDQQQNGYDQQQNGYDQQQNGYDQQQNGYGQGQRDDGPDQ